MSIYTHTYQVKETEVPIIISDEKNKSEISSKKNLKNRLTTGTVALLIALLAVVSATYAWYVYNTGRHTTKVRMAAGAGVNLQISNLRVSRSAGQFHRKTESCIHQPHQRRLPESHWFHQRNRKPVQSGSQSLWTR